MRQLVFIHGGETFDTYEEYLDALRYRTYNPKKEEERRWKHALAGALDGWDVHTPAMPGKYNAKYLEWSIWFEKVIPHLTDGVVLVGHSLGGIFLAKYLSEHALPIAIAGTFIVAAPFDGEGRPGSLADFVPLPPFGRFIAQGGQIFLYHSEDDPIVPFSALEKYQALLPDAMLRVFSDRGHFMQAEFPEILEDIQSL